MSQKERDRMKVLEAVEKREMTQRDAARLLKLSTRQVRRVVRRYREDGDAGLVHRLRGRPSNRRISAELRAEVLHRIETEYEGFGATLISEYLKRELGLALSRETLRGWMAEAGVRKPRKRRLQYRQWRERRPCFGELVQMDTSIHDWFEGRGEKAVLISMIDDATSRCWKRFFPTDSTETNMAMIKDYLEHFGRPRAIYADRASHFMTTRPATVEEDLARRSAETQIGRALRELGIEYIPANSPQAKGRVERSFETDQDRLVKGLRRADVSTLEGGNAYVDAEYGPLWDERFTCPPAQAGDAHRSVEGFDLEAILSVQQTRTVANDYTIRFENRRYQIERSEIGGGLRRGRVVVETRLDGTIWIRWRGRYLRHHVIEGQDEPAPSLLPGAPVGLRPPSAPGSRESPAASGRTLLSCG